MEVRGRDSRRTRPHRTGRLTEDFAPAVADRALAGLPVAGDGDESGR
ncbi:MULTISPECIES: hypothetical protein [unclassified Streptomyces]|nr:MULTISPECIES: hypothetical protein [unclassified Streptomyces]MYY05749.1 hypothetical protein [Streptomyces sp. SID4913]